MPNKIGKHTDLYVARYLLNLIIDFHAHLNQYYIGKQGHLYSLNNELP